jgi:UDP-N-acetylmuramoyl-tripeptide--D-alanyl-D-alanine ligase
MNRPTPAWLSDTLGIKPPAVNLDEPISKISIDTRTLQPGDAFWAIEAARDGHQYVAEAFSKGALLAVVSRKWAKTSPAADYLDRLIQVENTFNALTASAKSWRKILHTPIIAITGSNGKTTTKDILIHFLKAKFKTAGTAGNLNNELGIPLTLLGMEADNEAIVLEMGASKAGDIAYLCDVARPSHGLITSIGEAHLAGFKTLDGVAQAKGELYDYLGSRGIGFVPTDDPLCLKAATVLRQAVGFGFNSPPENWQGDFLKAANFSIQKDGCAQFTVRDCCLKLVFPGKPIAQAALAALTIAEHFGVLLQACIDRLNLATLTGGRASIIKIGSLTVLDDSYNANPVSMQSALDTLHSLPGHKKIAILGDMNELGDQSQEAHESLGRSLRNHGLSRVAFVGACSWYAAAEARKNGVEALHFASYKELEPMLESIIRGMDVILIKASRSIGLDRVTRQLTRLIN